MAKYNVNSDCSMTKAKTIAKAELMEVIENAVKAHYGEEKVKWVRSFGTSPKNEIGVIVGDISDSGFEYDLAFTIDTTCKPYKDGVRGNKPYDAYDIDEANKEYERYLTEKATKQAEAKAKKATNSKSKSKKEKEAEIAKREAELDEVAKRVKEKREKETAELVAKAKEKENQSIGKSMIEKMIGLYTKED